MALINLQHSANSKTAATNTSIAITQSIVDHSSVLFSADSATTLRKLSAGLESDQYSQSELNASFESIKPILSDAFSSYGLTEAGLESAARTAIILGDPKGLRESIVDASFQLEAGLESFSDERISAYRAATIEVNAIAGEGTGLLQQLYPIIETGANYGGISISVQRIVTVGNTVNDGTGEEVSWDRQHITEAYRKADLLAGSDTNRLYPIVITGTNEEYFADPELIGPSLIAGTDGLHTAPLKPTNDKINLLGLSRVASAVGIKSNHTYNDRINEGARIGSVHYSLGAEVNRKAFEMRLDLINTAQFIRGADVGKRNEVNATIDTSLLPLDLTTTQAKEQPELKAIADLGFIKLTFSHVVNMKLNLHDGNLTQTFGQPRVSGVYKENDNENYYKDSTLTAALAALQPKYEAVTIKATLSSKTLRLTGTRVDDETIPYTFNMEAQAPITADRAIDAVNVTEITSFMGTAEVIRRENEAVAHLVNNVSYLHEVFGKQTHAIAPHGMNIVGLAYITRPWIKIETINIADLVNTTESRFRRDDISNALVHLLGDRALTAITETAFLENLRIYTKNPTAKAEFNILTSRNIGRYLYTEGDDRSFGALKGEMGTKPEIMTTSLDIMDDKIIMVMKGTGNGETLDVFGWGNCLRGTTLVYDVELTAGDSVKRHLQLQPFYQFTINMPIAYELNVKGMGAYLASAAEILVSEKPAPAAK